jgi:aryl-alcohol dehydrogenase-like predicted oxidoreductase
MLRMKLSDYRTLGRSGLIVSPLCLGTMTMGTPRWGSADEVSEEIFHAFVDAGGNFIDTADAYANGRSEELIGGYMAARSLRDRVVLATKFTMSPGEQVGNPNGGANGRKNMYRALEGSLRRLKTDYIDLYWMHAWDTVTPAEEVLQSLGDLVRAGKIRNFGFSDVPAWYAAKVATLAAAHSVPGPIALQLEYSLVVRTIEREHVDCAREFGMGITPWSPLASGFLAGKYKREDDGTGSGEGRLALLAGGANPVFHKYTPANWTALDALREVAAETGVPMAQAALAWARQQPAVASLIMGATKRAQLDDNIASLGVTLTAAQVSRLNAASEPELVHPYMFFTGMLRRDRVFAGTDVTGWTR